MRIERNLLFLLILAMSSPLLLSAQTITAASCNATDVQKAFNSLTSSTTTVTIPAGTCHWTTQVTLTVPSGSSALSVLGAGNLTSQGGGDQTVIVDDYASGGADLLVTTAGASSVFRLAGITFQGGSGGVKYDGMIAILGNSANVRFDHSHINTTTYSPSQTSSNIEFEQCTYGVVDHSIFDNPAGSVNNAVRAHNSQACNGDSLWQGDQAWTHSTALGSNQFLFVENNTFNNGAADDCTFGGRFVFRFNTVNASQPAPSVQTHPTVGGRTRGCRAWEIYQNTFTAQSANYMNTVFFLSAGTGVFWGNTIPSSTAGGGTGYGSVIQLHSMRRDNSTYSETAAPAGWGYCGTSFNGIGSPFDTNKNTLTGYHCMDQPGMGQGDLLVGGFTSDGSGSNNVVNSATGCSSTSSCVSPREAIEPVYEWGDSYSAVPNNPSLLVNDTSGGTAFFANSDYYLGTSSFNGTQGVGSGPLGSRPSTCTAGVAYWATDQGSWNSSGSGGQGQLFKCTATNTWTLFYTPYTYPHPLISGSSGTTQTPAPPVSLTGTAK